MEVVYRSKARESNSRPTVSLILLDWACRESFHSLHYLSKQTVPRDTYEILWIEYYQRKPSQLMAVVEESKAESKSPIVDEWIVLGMPDDVCYHKHLMYNTGIVKSRGEIVVICDSDALYTPTFIEEIIKTFENNSNIVLHLDEVRNTNKKFYPFSYPSVEELLDEDFSNWKDGKTTGLWDKSDPLHSRNYGACMAARRADMIEVGGADEHFDYLGHVCGPYEMTFRLKSLGRSEVWHQKEFLYHTWHPGESGDANYVGPHDGRLISTTALEALSSKRILPLMENEAINILRTGNGFTGEELEQNLLDASYIKEFTCEKLLKDRIVNIWYEHEFLTSYSEYNIIKYRGKIYGVPKFLDLNDLGREEEENHPTIVKSDTQQRVIKQIDRIDSSKWFTPQIIEVYKDYNLTRYGCFVYGISHTLGNLNLHEPQDRRIIADFLGPTIEDVKETIDRADQSRYCPVLAATFDTYNIVKYKGKMYGVPHDLGKVDFTQEQGSLPSRVLSAETQEEVEALIKGELLDTDGVDQQLAGKHGDAEKSMHGIVDFPDPLADIPISLYEYKKHNVIRYNDYYYAIPYSLGAVDLSDARQHSHPEIISYDNRNEIHKRIDQLENARPIEFAGWLPSFQRFGNCGVHPQFAHVNTPPEGYRFTYSAPPPGNIKRSGIMRCLMRKTILLVRGFFVLIAVMRFAISAMIKGAKITHVYSYIRTRDIRKQALLKRKQSLVFLPSVPYTLGQHPWIIEIEDSISLLFPFFHNGETASVSFHESPYFSIFKTLLESKQCRGIITHMKSTAESLPKLFKSNKLSKKITYASFGIQLPTNTSNFEKENGQIHILFNNSWHQDPRSFFIRGGLDVLSAFDKLRKKYPNVFLTLRTRLPKFGGYYKRIIERNNVKVIEQFLPNQEWEALMTNSDIYLLPSDRIHVVSVLEAMSYGLAVVGSDGWGMDEYIQHGQNGMTVKGRYGKVTWIDEENGMLREDYKLMLKEDPAVVQELVEILTSLIEDKQLRHRISQQARKDVKDKYNLENWNKGLKRAFDRALGVNARV